jgi:hypothetical protein
MVLYCFGEHPYLVAKSLVEVHIVQRLRQVRIIRGSLKDVRNPETKWSDYIRQINAPKGS